MSASVTGVRKESDPFRYVEPAFSVLGGIGGAITGVFGGYYSFKSAPVLIRVCASTAGLFKGFPTGCEAGLRFSKHLEACYKQWQSL